MKTIEQAANEYAVKNDLQQAGQTKRATAFKAGAEFAQQWISVEDELPENGITVLIKDKSSHIGLACRRYGDWDCNFKNTVTHWRLITVK